MLKLHCLILWGLFFSTTYAIEVTKIQPKLLDDSKVQLNIEFSGRMITPPHFVPYKDTVAIKWQNANMAKSTTFSSSDFEILPLADDLLIMYKKSALTAGDISKLSIKMAGNTVKTVLPQLPKGDKKQLNNSLLQENKHDSDSVKKTPVDGIHSIEKKSPELVKNIKKIDDQENKDYLSYLLSSVDKASEKNVIKKNELPSKFNETEIAKREKKQDGAIGKTPVINIEKKLESKEAQNFTSYLLRIVLVLTFLVGAILLLAKISKKVMLGKNKLGFLNNSKIVEILNTTYIAPKRQLLLVKVHDQVMLLSNSESGLSFISEVKDLSYLLKTAEVEVAGSNFDTNLDKGPSDDSRVVLKDSTRLLESTPVDSKTSKMRSVLKNKAKSLKAWQ